MPLSPLSDMPPDDGLRQAEIVAMQQLNHNLAALNRSVEALGADMREVRDKVLKIEAQELKAAIVELRADLIKEVGELKGDLMGRIELVRLDHGARLAGLEGAVGGH